jgi:hypothetical protein
MRQKTYYTVDEITNNLYTIGHEFMTADNVEYVGPYHRYITGEIFTQPKWDAQTSVQLIQFKQIPAAVKIYNELNSITIQTGIPNPVIVQITSADINRGYIIRYFIKRINEQSILEIDNVQYTKYMSNEFDTNMYVATKMYWFINGVSDDVQENGVLVKGVVTKNQTQIKQSEQQVPGLSKLLTDPLQFYTDTDFAAPKDINA